VIARQLLIASLASTAFMAAERVHYSGLQIQQPLGTAFKMTPDPSNIWSFHETYKITKSGKHSVPVLVDFDNNGKMDTEHKDVRVMITDMVIRRGSGTISQSRYLLNNLTIVDGSGPRWLPAFRSGIGEKSTFGSFIVHEWGEHLVTPLVLPVDSSLAIEFDASVSNLVDDVHIHLIGRLVTL
jgi:hypothetical protein